jgi:hypothetical protein
MMERVTNRMIGALCAAVLLAASSSALAAPKIDCSNPDFNFGIKRRADQVTAVFTVANKGDQPLEIKRVIYTWYGTSPKVSAKTLAPGASATITVVTAWQDGLGAINLSGQGKAFKITAVEAPLPSVRTEVTPNGLGSYQIKISNLAPSPDLTGKVLVIKTDVSEMTELRVPIRVMHANEVRRRDRP